MALFQEEEHVAKRVTKKAVNPNEMDGKEFFEAIHQIEQEKG